MNDSLLYAGRDQRRAAISPDALAQLDAMAQAMNSPNMVDVQLDEALTVRWLSQRTGRSAKEIQPILGSVMENYFGKAMEAPEAYDRIVATMAAEAQGMELQTAPGVARPTAGGAQGQEAEAAPARDEARYPGWQTPRALGSGFQEFALNVPQGLFSAAAGALGERMPDLLDPMYDNAIFDLARGAYEAEQRRATERQLSGFDPGYDEAGTAATVAYSEAIGRINEANKIRVDEWGKTEGDATLRQVATFWKELADATDERWGVDPAFAGTGYGQFVKGVGSMPATSALMATGVAGLIGVGGATFAGVEKARTQYEGANYDPAAAFWSNMVNAGGQTIIESVIKLDGVLEKALANTAKTGGRVLFPDFVRSIGRTAIGEGLEEVAQGQWDDLVSVASYDEQRGVIPFVDEGVAIRRFWEFMAGAGGGAIMQGSFGGVVALEQNRAARKAGDYLTTRMGGLLNEYDMRQVRRAFTDAELRAMKDGETLLKAANGDKAAHEAYNRAVAAAKFVNLKGASFGGVTLGEVDGKPAIIQADGSILVVDVSTPEAAAAWDNYRGEIVKLAAAAEDERVTREAAVTSLIDYITALHAERDQSGTLTVDRGNAPKLVDVVGNVEEAQRIYESYVASGALPAGLDVRTLQVMGSSDTRWNEQAKRWTTAIKIAAGAQPTVVIEESVEDFVKRQLKTEELTVDRVAAWRAEVEGTEGALDERGAIEWLSKYAVAYATGKAQEGDTRLPAAFRAFLDRFARFVREALELGKKLLDMERAGEIPPDFLRLLQESTGTVAAKERGAVNEVPAASEIDAEMMDAAMKADDFPRISGTTEAGFTINAPDGSEIGKAATLEEAQDKAMEWYFKQEQNAERASAKVDAGQVKGDELMNVVRRLGGLRAASTEAKAGNFAGELRAIAENMSLYDRLRTFRKDGADLDDLRGALADEGFVYETPGDLLNALSLSTSGTPQFPTYGGDYGRQQAETTFSLVSTVTVAELKQNTAIITPARTQGRVKVYDLALALDELAKKEGYHRSADDLSDETIRQAAEALAVDMADMLSQDASGIGWYDRKVRSALELLARIHPEIATDQEAQLRFKVMLAAISQGNNVQINFEVAEKAYREFKKTKKLPTWAYPGKSDAAIRNNIERLFSLIDAYGAGEVMKTMTKTMTVKEWNALGYEVTGEQVTTQITGAMALMGSKIGSFFGNLNGDFSTLTADLWFSRTWNRIFGNMAIAADPNLLVELRKTVRATKGVGELLGYKKSDLLKDDAALLEFAEAKTTRYADGNYKDKTPLNVKANTVSKKVFGETQDTPRGGKERNAMRKSVEQAIDLLEQQGFPRLTVADAQAIIWYAEKDLFKAYDAVNKSGEKVDYEVAAQKVLESYGIANGLADEFARYEPPAIPRGNRAGQPQSRRRAKAKSGRTSAGLGGTFSLISGRAQPADASNVVELPDGAQLVGPTTFSITAFHGTPHKVDKFKLAKIGTGEGAQAYGWGLYFAEAKDVAMRYQPRNAKQEAAMMAEYKKAEARGDYDALEIWESAMLHKLPSELEAIYTQAAGYSAGVEKKAKAIAKKVDAILKKSGGALYTVELLPNTEEFLDWDAPLSAQSEKVRAIISGMLPEGMAMQDLGYEFYSRLEYDAGVFDKGSGVRMDGRGAEVAARLAAAGIPGIRYLDGASRNVGEGTRNYVIFDENLVKIIAENGRPVGGVAGATFSLTSAPVFYSRLVRTVEQSTQGKASGAQWKATIRNSKLGVNQDEFALVGVNDLEDGKTYTKAEVLDYLRANEVKVADVTLGAPYTGEELTPTMYQTQESSEYVMNKETYEEEEITVTDYAYSDGEKDIGSVREYPEGNYVRGYQFVAQDMDGRAEGFSSQEAAENWLGRKIEQPKGPQTEFESYTLPGAIEGSYREVLLTVPGQKSTKPVAWELVRPNGEVVTSYISQERADAAARSGDYIVRPNYGEGRQSAWQDGHTQYMSIANPIVRLRFNKRTTADGKRMLFLEEVQAPQKAEFEKMPELFQKNWREIGFKWALRKAVDGGFDVLGWTTGEQQAERYDLSKQLSKLWIGKGEDGDLGFKAWDKTGMVVSEDYNLNPAQLEDNIGKEFAAQAQALEPGQSKELTDEGLEIGGEGLTKLYDVDFRNVVNGLAAVKKAGQKAQRMTLEMQAKADVMNGEEGGVEEMEVNALELTDAIRGGAMGGQATFSLAQTDTPAFKKAPQVLSKKTKTPHGSRYYQLSWDGDWFAVRIADHANRAQDTYMSSLSVIAHKNTGGMQSPHDINIIVNKPLTNEAEARALYGDVLRLLPQKARQRETVTGDIMGMDVLVKVTKDFFEYAWENSVEGTIYGEKETQLIARATGNRGTFDPANPDITANLFYDDGAGRQERTAKMEELEAVLQKYGTLYTNATGQAALVRMREEGYLQAIEAGQAALRRSRKAGGQLTRIALPSDFRAGLIIPEVGRMMRARTATAARKATDDNEKVLAFYQAAKKAGMTTGNFADLDHALFNGHKDVADAIARKFGVLGPLDAVRAVFEAQMAEALELGVPPGKFFNGELDEETTAKLRDAMKQAKTLPAGQAGRAMIAILEAAGKKRNIESYWPRKVMNRDALLQTLGLPGLQDEFDKLMDKALAAARDSGRSLTEAEMDELVMKANANAQRRQFEGGRRVPGSLKARTIEVVSKEQMIHYYKGVDSAMKHNTAMREHLETLRFFGKSVVFEPSAVEFEVLPINVRGSVGAWIADYALAGELSSEQRRELENILIDRFNYAATPAFFAGLRAFSYLQNLTQLTTFLTATIADTWSGFYASGSSPYRFGKNFVKAMQGLSDISAMDVGLDPSRIAAEYEALEGLDPTFKEAMRGLMLNPLKANPLTGSGRDMWRADWTPSASLNRLFGWFADKVGLRYFERVTRETHINGAVDYLIAKARAGTLPRKLQQNLVRYFGEEGAARVLADLRAGRASNDDVRFYAFNALADWKAVSLDQMPPAYLANPRGRVFYMYKTWIAAQFAGLYHEAGQDIASGEPKRVAEGVKTMAYLVALMLAVGLPIDAIVSWVQGRPFILQDSVINRILGFVGTGRYVAVKLTQGEFTKAAQEFFAPPTGGALSDVQDDAEAIWYLGTDLDPQKLKVWRNLPGVGRVYNGYLGFKSEANAEARDVAGGWMALTDGKEPKRSKEELEAMKRKRLAKEYSSE